MGNYVGIIEMALSGAVVLGFCAYQYWQVRDAGKFEVSDDAGVAERDHEANDGGSKPV